MSDTSPTATMRQTKREIDMSWERTRDEFYEEHGDSFVVAWWNGEGLGSRGRQSCSFLTERTPAYGAQYALTSIWIDQAKAFDDATSAEAFLREQNDLRPHPLSGWFVTRIADLEQRIGYRVNTKASIIGDDSAPSGPRR